MKNLCVILMLALVLLFSGCSGYYQVYKTKCDNLQKTDNELVYEDDDCKIYYNLWGENGNSGFEIHNKTNSNIVLNKDKTFYILNGRVNDYFKNRTYSKKSSVKAKHDLSNGALIFGNSGRLEYKEKENLIIPPKSYRKIEEYVINKNRIIDCRLLKKPKRYDQKFVTYTKEDSPLRFSNVICYEINGKSKTIRHDFYVYEMGNFRTENIIYKEREQSLCGEMIFSSYKKFVDSSCDRFYIKYRLTGSGRFKH